MEPRGFSRVAAAFSSYDGDLSLPLGLRGKAGGGARVTAGPKRPHRGVTNSKCPVFPGSQFAALRNKGLDATTPMLPLIPKSDRGGAQHGGQRGGVAPKGLKTHRDHCFSWTQAPHQGQWQRQTILTESVGVGPRDQRALPLVSRTHTASQYLSTYETAWKPEDSMQADALPSEPPRKPHNIEF